MTMDLFAKLDPNEERERVFAVNAAEVLAEHLPQPVERGGFRVAATRLARKLVSTAREMFSYDDVVVERILVVEIGIILVVHLDRPLDENVAVNLGRRLASLTRKRFFSEKQGKKKDT